MKTDIYQDSFIEALREKIPERRKLANTLVDILLIDKEAIYRRLRGDVHFSFLEIADISKELCISLDYIIKTKTSKSRPFQFEMIDYSNPEEEDYQLLEKFLKVLKTIQNDPHSEIAGAMNIIPQSLCLEYSKIYKFYLFKWMYQYGSPDSVKHYHEIIAPERLLNINREIIATSREAGTSTYICDVLTFDYLINDIAYFYNIKLITKEEIELLKNELLEFLDNAEKFASNGCFDNGHKMRMFVSSINFETSYSYIESESHRLSMIKSFTLNDSVSPDEKIFQRLKIWMQSLKRTSTLVSESSEMERILFFKEQRQIVEKLNSKLF